MIFAVMNAIYATRPVRAPHQYREITGSNLFEVLTVLGFHTQPVAQLVEHRVVVREVVSSTPAGPTLRVFKHLRRKSCLCNYISKWLDFQVFSDKDYKPEVLQL